MGTHEIAKRLDAVKRRISAACERSGRAPQDVTLIAVSKGFPAPAVREAVAAGVTAIGENRVQEAQSKRPDLGDLGPNVRWHMIGHLQTNKVKAALDLFDIIHSVDSLRLAQTISKRARRPVPVFLEVNIAGEPSKYGFTLESVREHYDTIAALPSLDVRGLMTVAPVAPDPQDVRPLFRRLRDAAASLGLPGLSMGMTHDFEVAIEEGATHVRIGRAIFGERA